MREPAKEFWVSGWDGVFYDPGTVITVFVTPYDPNRTEAFKVIRPDDFSKLSDEELSKMAEEVIEKLKNLNRDQSSPEEP